LPDVPAPFPLASWRAGAGSLLHCHCDTEPLPIAQGVARTTSASIGLEVLPSYFIYLAYPIYDRTYISELDPYNTNSISYVNFGQGLRGFVLLASMTIKRRLIDIAIMSLN